MGVDPWKVREKFVSMRRDEEQLLMFLNEIGSWDLLPSLSVRDYWEWQDIFEAIRSNPGNWRGLATSMSLSKGQRLSKVPNYHLLLQPQGEFKSAIFSCANHSVLDAMIASVHIDEAKLLRRRPANPHKKTKTKGRSVKTPRGK